MMKTIITLSLITISIFNVSTAQDTIPMLKGNVKISVLKGTIDCDFNLSNIPRVEDYVIRINSGMNILNIKNPQKGNLLYYEFDRKDTMSSGETLAYYFPGPQNVGKFLPLEIHFRYRGMYPVIHDTAKERSVADWRGNLAFNGYALRADGLQSAWYPVLYDMKAQRRYEAVKYDVTITCEDCNTLYVNGSKPVSAKSANFKSSIPQELMIYCGNYETSFINGTYILNPDFDKTQQQEFGKAVNEFKKYYETSLAIPYKGDITFIQTTPTATDYGFLFVAYPTIINVGAGDISLKAFFDKKRGGFFKPYIAHELGHYYFGTFMQPNSEFGPVFTEGFTEYLSFKAVRQLISDSLYKKTIGNKIKALSSFEATPLARVNSRKDFQNREFYVYYYVPIILTAIESEIGEKQMWKWMRTVLLTKTDFTNYAFLEKTLESSLQDKNLLERIKANYLNSDKSLQNAVEKIGIK